VFSPVKSIIKKTFSQYIPSWILQTPKVETDWNACLQTLEGHEGPIWIVAFSPDGKTIAATSYDSTIRLWETATGEEKQVLAGHGGPVIGITFTNDGKKLVSAARDKIFRIWDVVTGKECQRITHGMAAVEATFSPNSDTVALRSFRYRTECWTFPECENLVTKYGRDVKRIAFSPDGEIVATLRFKTPGATIHDSQTGEITWYLPSGYVPSRYLP
jgi:WD40 repeat protein